MVKVEIIKNKDLINKVTISGHANYAKKGEDLVCASVSSLAIGTLNALDELSNNKLEIKINEGLVSIEILESEEIIQTILKVFEIQLKTIQESYKQYINISILEV